MSRTPLMTEDCTRFLQDAGVGTLRELTRLPSAVTVASSRSTRTVRVEAGGRALYVKDYRYATWKERFRILFRGGLFGRSRARREWDALAVLSRIGVGCPRAAALIENRRAGFLTGAIVATFEVEGAETLDNVLAREGFLAAHPAKRSLLGRIRPTGALVSERLRIRREYAEILEDAGLADFDGVWAFCEGRVVTRHRDRSAVEFELTHAGETRTFYLKRLSRAHLKHIIEALLALEWPVSRCRREWEFAEALSGAGVSAAGMAAMGERRLGLLPLESFLVVEAVRGAETLDVFLAGPAAPKTHRERTAFIAALARTLARMHSAGLFHRDLYAKHIFVRREGGESVINIIDLQRMRRGGGRRFVAADLTALNVTLPWRAAGAADRLRFLHEYVRARWGSAPDGLTRRLAQDTLKRSRHIAGRKKFRSIEWRRPQGK